MKKILLISYNFRTSNLISAERTWFLFEELLRRGYEVRVLTSDTKKLDDKFKVFEHGIIRIGDRREKIIRWTDNIQLNKNFNSIIQDSFKKLFRKSIEQKHINLLINTFFWPGREKKWCKSVQKNIDSKLSGFKPDFIISTSPPIVVHGLANELSKKYKCPWSADYRDLHSLGPYYKFPEFLRSFDKKREVKVLESASLVTHVSKTNANIMKDYFRIHGVTIYNGFDIEMSTQGIELLSKNRLNITYTGVLYDSSRTLGIDLLLQELVRFEDKRWVLNYFGKDFNKIEGLSQFEFKRYVNVLKNHGYVDRKIALIAQEQSDILLLSLSMDSDQVGVVSGKFFDYLASGKPILMIGSRDSEVAKIIRDLDVGDVCTNRDEISKFLNRFENKEFAILKESNPRQRSIYYSRQTQSKIWADEIDKKMIPPPLITKPAHTLSKPRVLHISSIPELSQGILRQKEMESEAALKLGISWKSLVYCPVLETDSNINSKIIIPISMHRISSLLHRSKIFRGLFIRVGLYKWLKDNQHNFDIILIRYVVHDPWLLWFLIRSKISVALVHHSFESNEIRTPTTPINLVRLLAEMFIRNFISKTTAITISVTPEISKYNSLRKVNPNQLHLIYPNGILQSNNKVKDLRSQIPEIIFIASYFSPWHGLDLILDQMKKNSINFKLHLVGNLSSQDLANAKMDDRIVVHGNLTQNRIAELYSTMWMSLSSLALYRNEMNQACPLKNRESLSLGIPVYGSHEEVFPQSFKFYKQGPVELQEIIKQAIAFRKFKREEVIKSSEPLISKSTILQNLYNQLCEIHALRNQRPH